MQRKTVWIPNKEKGFISLVFEQPHQFGLWGGSSWLHQTVMDSIRPWWERRGREEMVRQEAGARDMGQSCSFITSLF